MPQPTQSDVHVNAPLTNISIAYIQNARNFISDRVFPIVPVDKQADLYWLYTKNDWFRDEAKLRGAGAESAGGGYNLDSSNSYYCHPYAFHKDIPDQLRKNADSGLNLDRDATELITQRLLVRRERIWAANYFATSKWAKDYTGVAAGAVPGTSFIQWSDYASSDPIADIELARMYILGTTGYKPNKLVCGAQTFSKLKHHPDVVDRYKYTNSDVITADMLAKLFEVDELLVGESIYATNAEGGTAAYDFINGKGALLVYSAPTPSLLVPSGGYTFAWKGMSGMGSAIRMKSFRMEHLESDRVEGEYAFDCKLIASDMGVFFATAVA